MQSHACLGLEQQQQQQKNCRKGKLTKKMMSPRTAVATARNLQFKCGPNVAVSINSILGLLWGGGWGGGGGGGLNFIPVVSCRRGGAVRTGFER